MWWRYRAIPSPPVNKVEFYVDWNLQQTSETNPFSFSWNASSASAGRHTLAAMAYDAGGMRACYAIWLEVQ